MVKKIFLLLFILLSTTMMAQRGTFRFAQLTDIHLSRTDAQPTEYLLKSIAQINATDSIDFVLVTGDLTEEGDRTTLNKVKECLNLLKVPVYVIMGNHETKWSDSGCTAFSSIFGGEHFEFIHQGILFLGFNSGPLMRMAFGHVSPQDITWMKQEIEHFGTDKPVILVTHYPLLDGDVDNWYDVTDAVRPYNVRLFIGGHYHQLKDFSYDGIPGILMRSNLADDTGKPGYGIYDVTADSIIVYTQRIGEKRQRFTAFSMSKEYFDHHGHADHYPNFDVNKQYPEVKEVWKTNTGTAIFSSPITDGKHVFVGDDAGRLLAYNKKSGKLLWTFPSKARIVGTPAATNGIVVFGSADRNIYALDANTGSLRWNIATSGPVLGAAAIDNGTAYIGASDSTMRAIDVKSGQIKWTYRGVRGYIETKPLVTSDRIIFGAWDNTLYCLDKNDGKEMWRWTGGLTRMHFSPAAVWPVAANGKVFIVDPQRAMTAIDINNGKTIWRTFQSKVRESIGISRDGKDIFAKTMEDSLVCYAALGDNPTELWASNLGFGYEHAPSMPLECYGMVFGGTATGLIYAVNAKNGNVIWKHKIDNSLINTVLPLSAQEVLVTSSGGNIVLLKNMNKKTIKQK
jgi:outer membrane protein assembly factor BamB/Icc-related predicted phosphoesterase